MDFTNLYRIIRRDVDTSEGTFIKAPSLRAAAQIAERDEYNADGLLFVGYIAKD